MKIAYALISLASASSGYIGNYGSFLSPAPDVKDFKIWEEALTRPNGTGKAEFKTGYDITQPYPGTPMEGWSMNLSVTADVPAITKGQSHPPKGSVFTGAQYDLNFPSDVHGQNVTLHPSWIVSQNFITVYDGKLGRRKNDEKVNTDCTGWLSDKCRNSILQSGESVGDEDAPVISLLDVDCDVLHDSDTGGSMFTISMEPSGMPLLSRIRTGSEASMPGNRTGFNDFINRVEIVITQFSRNSTVMPDAPKGVKEEDLPKTVLTCMSVQEIHKGSSSNNTGSHDHGSKDNGSNDNGGNGNDDGSKGNGDSDNSSDADHKSAAAAIGVHVWFALTASLLATILI